MFKSISLFIYGNEFIHKEIRNKTYQEAYKRKNILPIVIIETERGNIKMNGYIKSIKKEGNYAGDLELSIEYDLY